MRAVDVGARRPSGATGCMRRMPPVALRDGPSCAATHRTIVKVFVTAFDALPSADATTRTR